MGREDELARELALLSERASGPGENGELPRGKQPALFRAARAAANDPARAPLLASLGEALGARLADRPLLEPLVLLAPGGARALEHLVELARDEGTPALEAVPGGDLARALVALVEARLATPSSRRDRTSQDVARGALRLLAARAASEASVLSLASRVIEAETRRARGGSGEDLEVALAALLVLERAEPVARLRAAHALSQRVDAKKVEERLAEIARNAALELGASPEDQRDLLAQDGLGPDGTRRIELEDGRGHLTLTIDASGQVRTTVEGDGSPPPTAPSPLRGEGVAVEKARAEQARHLERALGAGRTFTLSLFRAIFTGENGVLADLARRLVWLAAPASGSPISFRPRAGGLEDVFSSELPTLAETTPVRLAHYVELDRDELELWRERFREGGPLVQPFPQLHRLVEREPANALERFPGREAYREEVAELARERGYRGLPLRGDGPWEIARDFPSRGAVLTVVLEPVAGPAPPPRPRRDALRVFDEPERAPRAPREAAPRARVAKATIVGAQDAVALAEAASDLHALTDSLACGTESFFSEWQKRKFKDPALAWREAQEKLSHGSEAAWRVRAALVSALVPGARLQGRWALLSSETFVELGSGHVFTGPLRDFVPRWKVDERVKRAAPSLPWPFPRETDAETARVVEAVFAYRHSHADSQEETKAGAK